jgi:hypothetical protein
VQIELKKRMANAAIWAIIITISIIALWFIAFITITVFKLNIFAARTTEFFGLLILAAFAIVICAAFLNISLNISLIADSRTGTEKKKTQKRPDRKVWLIAGLGLAVFIGLLFMGDLLSRQANRNRLVSECNDILRRYDKPIQDMVQNLSQRKDLEEIPMVLDFLSNQKNEFPDVSLITSTDYQGQISYLILGPHTPDKALTRPFFDRAFYKTKKEDARYLESVFKSGNTQVFLWSEGNDYYLYKPVRSGKSVYILRFSKYQRYGKIGS